jgi:hypothetical protein
MHNSKKIKVLQVIKEVNVIASVREQSLRGCKEAIMQNPKNFYPQEWFADATPKIQRLPVKEKTNALGYERQRLSSGCVLLTMSLRPEVTIMDVDLSTARKWKASGPIHDASRSRNGSHDVAALI